MLDGGEHGYGYGWFVEDRTSSSGAPARVISHSGGLPGISSRLHWEPAHDRRIVILSNVGYCPVEEMSEGIRSILDGEEANSPEESDEVVVLGAYLEKGREGFNATALHIRQTRPLRGMPGLSRFTDYVHALRHVGRHDQALRLLELQARLFGAQAAPHCELARHFLALTEYGRARQHATEALARDPRDPAARQLLEQLREH